VYRVHDGRQRPPRGVTGHLQDGKSHVAADAERDAEPDAAENSQVEPSGAAGTQIAAVWTAEVTQLIQRSLTSATATFAATHLVRYFIELSVIVRYTCLRIRWTDTAHASTLFIHLI